MREGIAEWSNAIHQGDSLDVLDELPSESVHAIVTDPPYGLAFMGRDWDDFEPKEYQEWCQEWAEKALRVLKPGGHLLAFSGNRTHHRLFSGVEDAGFTVRDTVTWHYGSGFPKALDVGKAIQKQNGVEPEQVDDASGVGFMNSDDDGWNKTHNQIQMPEPTGEAKRWDGFKTALKPATEYVVVARKPLPGTVAECMQTHGTGALNIDGCRIATNESWEGSEMPHLEAKSTYERSNTSGSGHDLNRESSGSHPDGRYPANVVFDETQADALDREVGETTNGTGASWDGHDSGFTGDTYADFPGERTVHSFNDSGGPSRYFYTSKASRAERTLNGKIDNAHPTVKPADLMEWLVKLVTAEGQIVLDPFAGSGTTCRAAKDLNRRFIGIEKQSKWADVARVRCGLTPDDPANVRADNDQSGLEAFTDGGSV